jgi:hypothetical protein
VSLPTPPRNDAVRRFAAVQVASLAVKIAAVLVLLVLAVHYLGGS